METLRAQIYGATMNKSKISNLLKDQLVIATYFLVLIGLSLSNAAWNTWKITHNLPEMGDIYEYGLIYGFSISSTMLIAAFLIYLKFNRLKHRTNSKPNTGYSGAN
jgi:hypothetical protein